MRPALFALLIAVPVALADDAEPKDTKTKARELEVTGLPTRQGRFEEPTKITSKAELEKLVKDEATVKAINKQVDFEKEYLALFQWAGSGQDKLTFEVEKQTATFTHTPGKTRDLRKHAKLFALPLKTEIKLAK